MKRPTPMSPVRTTLVTAATSAAVALFMAGSAWAITPPASLPAGTGYGATTPHAFILAQSTESSENGAMEEEHKGMEQEHAGMQKEHAGMEEEQAGMAEEQKGMEEEHKGMEDEQEGMQHEDNNK